MKLTDEQQAIVNHTTGPGLVFAVAGSGKTTSMVHRVKHLLDKRIVTPDKILTTSFNNSAVQDIILQLAETGVENGVHCRTLHAIGFAVIRNAVQRRYLSREWLQRNNRDAESISRQLISKTLVQLAMEQGCDVNELNVDREDLKNQISVWKGNLIYADLATANLPENATDFTEQAVHKHAQYVLAYRKYEQFRQQQKLITFDDMLMTGWELLLRHPDILKSFQSAYQMVMVDEFQDVNFAQYQLIDLITQPHRNYMAIGDDDQCIYEWRGANPRFILDFEKVYGAKVYKISDNFRSTAQQVVLANQVISRNENRFPKQLSLTRGFGGATSLQKTKDDAATATAIVKEIRRLYKQKKSPADMAILIRLYSQTAYLETELIAARIPYQIVGSSPFYARDELIPLFQYLSFAAFEAEIRRSGFPDDDGRVEKYFAMFRNIVNQPRRYLSKNFLDSVVNKARSRKASLLETVLLQKKQLKPGSAKNAQAFVQLINELILKLKKPAHKVLTWLVGEIEYAEHLLNISGMQELGVSRVQNVDALIDMSRKRGKCEEFLAYIREISLDDLAKKSDLPPLKIMTIYRAKGLEWETVFLPGCNKGLIPCLMDEKGEAAAKALEAERRLFYVAVTRAKKQLNLYTSEDREISPFLAEIDAATVLTDLEKLQKAFQNQRSFYKIADVIHLCQLVERFNLGRFLIHWKRHTPDFRDYIQVLLDGFSKELTRADAAQEKYLAALEKYRAAQKKFDSKSDQLKAALMETDLVVWKFKSALHTAGSGEEIRFERFEDGDVMVLSRRGVIGVLELKKMKGFDSDLILWEDTRATLAAPFSSGNLYTAELQTLTLNPEHPEMLKGQPLPPEKPPKKYQDLLSTEFRRGLATLQKITR